MASVNYFANGHNTTSPSSLLFPPSPICGRMEQLESDCSSLEKEKSFLLKDQEKRSEEALQQLKKQFRQQEDKVCVCVRVLYCVCVCVCVLCCVYECVLVTYVHAGCS